MLINLEPEYGVNYDAGYIGFSYRMLNPLSHGITWIDHKGGFDIVSEAQRFSHVFMVAGEDAIYDSSWKLGVQRRKLKAWLADPHMRVVFRKLRKLEELTAGPLLAAAEGYVEKGYTYDKRIFLAMAMIHSTAGKLLPENIRQKILNAFDVEEAFVCSSYVTRCAMDGGYTILDDHRLTPRELFSDIMFKPLNSKYKGAKI